MTSRERVFSALQRRGYDRIPVKHEGTPIENILAMYRRAGSLCETIDNSILKIKGDKGEGKINMSKLF